MAVGSDDEPLIGGLTEDQIEQFTDAMICKLATLQTMYDGNPEDRPTGRDEIRLTVVDAGILFTSDDPAARLDEWLDSV